MKKILIMVLSAIASLGVAFGASVVASADELTLSDLYGKEYSIDFESAANNELSVSNINIALDYNSTSYYGLNLTEQPKLKLFTSYDDGKESWTGTDFDDLSSPFIITFGDSEAQAALAEMEGYIAPAGTALTDFLNLVDTYGTDLTPAPAETGNLWTSILTGIGGFLSGMFALISGAFTGVVNVFYANNTATIILQALIFAAAAALVAAAVYVVVRLIKSAVARLRGGVGAAGAKGDKNKKSKRFFFRKRR